MIDQLVALKVGERLLGHLTWHTASIPALIPKSRWNGSFKKRAWTNGPCLICVFWDILDGCRVLERLALSSETLQRPHATRAEVDASASVEDCSAP